MIRLRPTRLLAIGALALVAFLYWRPIVGLSHHQTAVQQMALEWGVTPVLMPQTENVEDLWTRSLEVALKCGVIESGDRVVTTAGTAVNLPGSTNVIKVDIA